MAFLHNHSSLVGAAIALCFACSSVHAASSAPVATLDVFSGKVLINNGEGFVPAVLGMPLLPHNKLFVGENSNAMLNYGECAVTVEASSVVAVPSKSPCAKGEFSVSLRESSVVAPASSESECTGSGASCSYQGSIHADGQSANFFAPGAGIAAGAAGVAGGAGAGAAVTGVVTSTFLAFATSIVVDQTFFPFISVSKN